MRSVVVEIAGLMPFGAVVIFGNRVPSIVDAPQHFVMVAFVKDKECGCYLQNAVSLRSLGEEGRDTE